MPILAWLLTGLMIIIMSVNRNSVFFLGAGLLALLYVFPFGLAFISLKLRLTAWPTEICSGDLLPFSIEIENKWPLPILNLKIQLVMLNSLNQKNEVFGLVIDLNPFIKQKTTWKTGPLPRGIYHLEGLLISGRDPFGLLSWTRSQQLVGAVKVFPLLLPLFPRPFQGGYTGEREVKYLRNNAGMLPDGIRNYIPGDSLAKIHWKATANQGYLVSKAFNEETGGIKVLILGYWGDCQEENEALITAGASLTWAWFQAGLEFYFLLDAQQQHNLGLVRTPEALEQIMELLTVALPKAKAGAEKGLVEFLLQSVTTGVGEIILLTSSAEVAIPENWQQAGWETRVVALSAELDRERIVEILEGVGQ